MTTAASNSQHNNNESAYGPEDKKQDHQKKISIKVKAENSLAALYVFLLIQEFIAELHKLAHREYAESFFSTGNNGS